MKEKIKSSWRFRIANWILGGTLEKDLTDAINVLETFLNISRWPTEPDGRMSVDCLELHLIGISVSILLDYCIKHGDTFKFKLANFVCMGKLKGWIRGAMYSIYDILCSIENRGNVIDYTDIYQIRFSVTRIKVIMDI